MVPIRCTSGKDYERSSLPQLNDQLDLPETETKTAVYFLFSPADKENS